MITSPFFVFCLFSNPSSANFNFCPDDVIGGIFTVILEFIILIGISAPKTASKGVIGKLQIIFKSSISK